MDLVIVLDEEDLGSNVRLLEFCLDGVPELCDRVRVGCGVLLVVRGGQCLVEHVADRVDRGLLDTMGLVVEQWCTANIDHNI